ncbi:unnamed protein product [Blepharisma stoltei]|uniref:Uncharacterized protein n=1 Tax=Blepharisma stoltei TaxID=1481888 RepID=A0AAU9J1Z2_9CILI|nr:unnamed protein product [Blepharisma stoltei]
MIDELADVSKKNQKLIFQYEMRIKELENLLEINREEIDNNPIENNKFQNDLKIKYDCLKHELKRTEFKWRIKLQRLRIKEEILLRQINLTKNEIETIYTKFKKIKDIENNQNSKEFNLTSLRQKSNTPVMCFDYEKPVSSTFRINKSFAYYAHKGE